MCSIERVEYDGREIDSRGLISCQFENVLPSPSLILFDRVSPQMMEIIKYQSQKRIDIPLFRMTYSVLERDYLL